MSTDRADWLPLAQAAAARGVTKSTIRAWARVFAQQAPPAAEQRPTPRGPVWYLDPAALAAYTPRPVGNHSGRARTGKGKGQTDGSV